MPVRRSAPHSSRGTPGSSRISGLSEHGIAIASSPNMNARSVLLWGFALVTASLVPACAPTSLDASSSTDGSAPDGALGGGDDSGSATSSSGSSSGTSSSSGSSSGEPDAAVTDEDSGGVRGDSGRADASGTGDSGACIRPPFQTTNECTGIGKPGGPVIPSCSKFSASGQLICPSIPGCTVVPDPSGEYCEGDNVTCGLSDCGHICILPDWDPCYDVATGECLEGC